MFEILINGLKRGVSLKHRYREKSRYIHNFSWALISLCCRPRVSRIALLHSFNLTLAAQKNTLLRLVQCESINLMLFTLYGSNTKTYLQLKLSASDYQAAKEKLMGEGGPFVRWLMSGSQWQEFNQNGEFLITWFRSWKFRHSGCPGPTDSLCSALAHTLGILIFNTQGHLRCQILLKWLSACYLFVDPAILLILFPRIFLSISKRHPSS